MRINRLVVLSGLIVMGLLLGVTIALLGRGQPESIASEAAPSATRAPEFLSPTTTESPTPVPSTTPTREPRPNQSATKPSAPTATPSQTTAASGRNNIIRGLGLNEEAVRATEEFACSVDPYLFEPSDDFRAQTAAVQQHVLIMAALYGYDPGVVPADRNWIGQHAAAIHKMKEDLGLPTNIDIGSDLWIAIQTDYCSRPGWAGGPASSDNSEPTVTDVNQARDYVCKTPTEDLPPLVTASSNATATRHLQVLLTVDGYDPGPLDGQYGPRSISAVKAFQADHPPLAVDGQVGPKTWFRVQYWFCHF